MKAQVRTGAIHFRPHSGWVKAGCGAPVGTLDVPRANRSTMELDDVTCGRCRRGSWFKAAENQRVRAAEEAAKRRRQMVAAGWP